MTIRQFIVVLPLLGLCACAQFPQLEGTIAPEAANLPYPELVSLEPILAAAETPAVDPNQIEDGLNARLSALRIRAARLRGSVLSGAEKERLSRGLG